MKVLVVSDVHVGSTYAVMPDEVYVEERDKQRSNRVESNPLQKQLYRAWQQMCDIGKVDACLVLGDCCDGANLKSRGFELWTTNLHQQVKTCADLLSMVKTSKYYGVQGSYYHVGENSSTDLAVIDLLNGTFGTDLVVQLNGKRVHMSHEVAYSSSPVSKATAPQKELMNAIIADKYFGEFDLLIRGHRHEYINLETVFGHIICAPGWKLRDSYSAKKGLTHIPQIGYVLLDTQGSITVDRKVWVPEKENMFREIEV